MGCFSWMCYECGKAIKSNSFTGEDCRLYLLIDGEIKEMMSGLYDSFGAVFAEKWEMDWGDVVAYMYDGYSKNGIAAVHQRCFTGKLPTQQSEPDPNQGWGENFELFTDSNSNYQFK